MCVCVCVCVYTDASLILSMADAVIANILMKSNSFVCFIFYCLTVKTHMGAAMTDPFSASI